MDKTQDKRNIIDQSRVRTVSPDFNFRAAPGTYRTAVYVYILVCKYAYMQYNTRGSERVECLLALAIHRNRAA